jgi:hypothetical protein
VYGPIRHRRRLRLDIEICSIVDFGEELTDSEIESVTSHVVKWVRDVEPGGRKVQLVLDRGLIQQVGFAIAPFHLIGAPGGLLDWVRMHSSLEASGIRTRVRWARARRVASLELRAVQNGWPVHYLGLQP